MRMSIIAIGRARVGPESMLFKHYCERINSWSVNLVEKELRKKIDNTKIATVESELLMKAIPKGAFIVAFESFIINKENNLNNTKVLSFK